MFKLVSPQFSGKYDWRLLPGSYVAGRDPNSDFVLNDSTVSRRHARFDVVDSGAVSITDLGSLNGTLVNDRQINGTVVLKAGDTISLGSVGLLLLEDSAAPTRPQVVAPSEVIDKQRSHTVISAIPLDEGMASLAVRQDANPALFKAVADMAKMLTLPQTLDEMFDQALSLLDGIVTAQRFAIFLATPAEEEVRQVAHRTNDPSGSQQFTMPRSIVREVLMNKNAVSFSDLVADDRFARQESIVIQGIRSAMAIPLIDEDKVLGILYADSTDPQHRYNEDTLKVAAAFGNILAAKITHQLLMKERQAKEALESELKIASQIQEGLMPRELPMVEGYHFHAYQMQCKMVGGDLYDVARLADGRVLFLLADVSGKGMGAALLASNILSAFRMLRANPDFNVLEAVCRVSEQLHNASRSGDFATLFVGILDYGKHEIEFVNAGHNPPIIVTTAGELRHLDSTGIPIGIFGSFEWEKHTINLNAGDRLVLFTDGIPEAMTADGSLYSDDRVEEFLRSHRSDTLNTLAESLLAEVSRFVGNAPPSDDMTIVLLERRP